MTGDVVAQGAPGLVCIEMLIATVEGNVAVETDREIDVSVEQTNGSVEIIIDGSGGDVGVGGNVDGDIIIDGNGGAVGIVGNTGGDVIIDGSGGDIGIDGNTSGDVIIDGSGGDIGIDGNTDGDVIIDGSGGDIGIDGNAGGDVIIDGSGGDIGIGGDDFGGNITVTTSGSGFGPPNSLVSVSILGTSVTGSITLLGVGPTTITAPGPLTIGGDLQADNLVAPIDLSNVTVGGFTALTATGSNTLLATAAALSTDTTVATDTDTATLSLPEGATGFGDVIFMERLGGTELPPEIGLGADRTDVLLDPYARYTKQVGDGTLAAPATVTLTLVLDNLLPEERTALGDAIDMGQATLATADSDQPLVALPICADETPTEGCTTIRLLDAQGIPTTFELASTAEFVTLTTTFSDWAIVLLAGAVPTASEWGLIVMSGCLLIAGIGVLHRRRASVSID